MTDKRRMSPSKGKVKMHWIMDGGRTKGWVHTHGMDRLRLPELEIRECPAFLGESAAHILRAVCDYMLDSGTAVKAGETMGISERTTFRFAKPSPIPGEEQHYEVERLQIVEMEGCCDECRIPDNPEEYYWDEWRGWADFLGVITGQNLLLILKDGTDTAEFYLRFDGQVDLFFANDGQRKIVANDRQAVVDGFTGWTVAKCHNGWFHVGSVVG
jgi:hypothetical protein